MYKDMARIYYTTGESAKVSPKNGQTFQLEELYDLIDCEYIQVLNIPDTNAIAIMDEEGKFNENARINEQMTDYLRRTGAIYPHDFIVGNVIICDDEELD